MLICMPMIIEDIGSVQYDFKGSVVECVGEMCGCIAVLGRALGRLALVT